VDCKHVFPLGRAGKLEPCTFCGAVDAISAIVTTPSERRQIARVIRFGSDIAQLADWAKVAQMARELGAHWEARTHKDDSLTVTMFWSYAEGEER
jgi:hypothetical protein